MLVDPIRYDTLELLAVELDYFDEAMESSMPGSVKKLQMMRSVEKIGTLREMLRGNAHAITD